MFEFLSLLLLLFGSPFNSKQSNVKVSIYYESLCPDSIRFITQQLSPNYEAVADQIDVDFVPYGKATHVEINGEWQFVCQHGPNECHGNMLQACALTQTSDQAVQVNFVNCVMGSVNPSSDGYVEQCAEDNGLSWSGISSCVSDGTGGTLLAALGDRTHAVTPIITFVPTIVYNDSFDQELQDASLTDFLGTVCGVIGGDVC